MAVLATWALLPRLGERTWLSTLFLFGPRVGLMLPPIVLAAAAGWAGRRRLWALHAATALVVAGPMMGFSIPASRLFEGRPQGPGLKLLTLNQGGSRVDAVKLIELIEREKIQLVFLQESYFGTDRGLAPKLLAFFDEGGWHRDSHNTIASRFPGFDELEPMADVDGPNPYWKARLHRARIRAASGLEFVVASIHFPTFRPGIEGLISGDLDTFRGHAAWRAERMGLVALALAESGGLPMLVGADFNTPPESPLMETLDRTGLRDGFVEAGWGYGYTRPAGFPWIRIDYLLATPPWVFARCWAGPKVGSDHLPVLAEVVFTRPKRPGR